MSISKCRPYDKAYPRLLYHGTSSHIMETLKAGRVDIVPTFGPDDNPSLGGAYFTDRLDLAETYARHTDLALTGRGGTPLVLWVCPIYPLLPDEDWVASDVMWHGRVDPNVQYRDFMNDLFVGYLGEGFSLSDHYRKRYDELNEYYGITWKHSWRWMRTVRQAEPLALEQVMAIKPVAVAG